MATLVVALLGLGPASEGSGVARPQHAPWSVDWAAPQFSALTELRGLGISADDFFGAAVATSGATTVVGVPYLSGGRAYVFAETARGWRQVTELQGKDTQAGDYFGISVGISGPTIVVGANGAHGSGRAYVFTKLPDGWRQAAELSGTGFARGAAFGSSVAVSGSTVVVGAPLDDIFSGAAEVFQRSLDGWRPVARIVGDDTSIENNFGFSVAISGSTIAVGAPGRLVGKGRVYIFRHGGGGWHQVVALEGADSGLGDNFGYSLAISGNTLVVGAPWHDSETGAAYAFAFDASVWRQAAELEGHGTVPGDRFGFSVAISGDTIVVGAPMYGNGAGEAYLFGWATGRWRQAAALTGPGAATGDAFGTSAAVAGPTVAIGASRHDDGDGAVYLSRESAVGRS